MQKAVAVKAQRMLGVEPDAAPTSNEEINSSMPVLTAYELYIMELEESDNYSADWIRGNKTTMRLLEYFIEEKHIKATRLLEIDKAFVTRFLSYLSKDYFYYRNKVMRRLSNNTIYHQQTTLNAFFAKMVRDGDMRYNPLSQLDVREKMQKPLTARDYLTIEEMEKLATAYTGGLGTKEPFMFCCFTGLRYKDVCTLTWGDIRKTDSGYSIYKVQHKTQKVLSLPLCEQAMKWLPERGSRLDEDHVFAVTTRGAAERALKHMAKRVGIEKNIHFHMSRHTFAMLNVNAGTDILVVSKLMGHTSVKSTQRYAHINLDNKIKAVNLMKGLF